MSQEMTIERRREILQREIAGYLKQGYRVVSQTDVTAQLVKPKQFSCLWAIIWTLVVGIGLLFYLFWYWAAKDQTVYIEVDEHGRVKRR